MSKILLGWEYGEGFGHVALLLPLAKALKAAGHEPVMALRLPRETRAMWKDAGIPVIQAPFLKLTKPWDRNVATDTMCDSFVLAGFSKEKSMLALADAWQNIVQEIKPELVIAETSPTLAMVTLGRIPTVTIGTGYSMPPAGMRNPSARFWQKERHNARSLQHELITLQAINAARRKLQLPDIAFFSDLFGGEASFVCTIEELDCYRDYRKTPNLGPLEIPSLPPLLPLPSPPSRLFAYLAQAEPMIEKIVLGIKQSGMPCHAFIRGASADFCSKMQNENLRIYTEPQSLPDIVPGCALMIHHGGLSTTDLVLRLGVPQFILSRHLEQKTNGASIVRMDCGALAQMHEVQAQAEIIPRTIRKLATHARLRSHTQKTAQALRSRQTTNAVEKIVRACLGLLPKAGEEKQSYG